MDNHQDVDKELEREREKLDQMINDARQAHQPSNETILEQSRKVDSLLVKVQKKQGKSKAGEGKHINNQQER
jgi:hypothetical protein